MQKLKDVLSSKRFWELVAVGAVIYLQTNDWRNALITILIGSVGVETIDKLGKNIGK
jgi:hypothetical protein